MQVQLHKTFSVTMKTRVLLGAAALVVCATAMAAGPSRKELSALLQNPASDWSIIFPDVGRDVAEPKNGEFTEEQGAALDKQSGEFNILRELADLDAIAYVKSHPRGDPVAKVLAWWLAKNYAVPYDAVHRGRTFHAFAAGHINS